MQEIETDHHVFLARLGQLKSYVNVPVMLKALLILSAVFLIYGSDLRAVLLDAFQNESTNYILLVPLIFGYFLYRKRKMLKAGVAEESKRNSSTRAFLVTLSGILLCITAVLLCWYAANTFSTLEYQLITLPIFIAGLVLALFDFQTLRQLAFPIFFLLFLVPVSSQVLASIGSALSVTASGLSARIVNLLGVHAEILSQDGNPMIMVTRANKAVLGFSLDLSCSGVYSFLAFLVFGLFMAYVTRGAVWKKAVIFLVGFPLIYFLNIVRITSILLIGFSYGQNLALEVFHLLSGLVLIGLGTVFLLAIMEKLFGTGIFRSRLLAPACTRCMSPGNVNEAYCFYCGKSLGSIRARFRKRDVTRILAAALLVVLLIGIQTSALAQANKPLSAFVETQNGEQGNTQLLPEVSGYTLAFMYRDTNFEKLSHEDAALTYLYQSDNESQETISVSIELAETFSLLHNWEMCLITYGSPPVTQLDLRDTQILDNPPRTGRYFAFEYPNSSQIEVVLYWFDQSTFVLGNETKSEYAKISLISFPGSSSDVGEAENILLEFGSQVARYWQPLKTRTAVFLMISQNGWMLAIVTTALLAGTLGLAFANESRERKAKGRIYQKLSQEDRQIVDSVRKAAETSQGTLGNVETVYSKITQRKVDNEELRRRLIQAEAAGIMSKKIISQSDEPFQTWVVTAKI